MTDEQDRQKLMNDFIRSRLSPAQKFTVVRDGRSGAITTTTADGHTYTGRDGLNDAFHHYLSGAEPRNRRRDDDESGGAA